MTPSKVDLAFTTALPKTELHAHLSGSISRETLHSIWLDKQSRGSCLDLEDPLSAIRPGGDFVDIVTFFPLFDKYIYRLCDDVASVRIATRSVLEDFARDGVRHLELRTTPRENPSTGMGWEEYVVAVNETIAAWNSVRGAEEGMMVFLILSVDRKMSAEQATHVVDLAARYRHRSDFEGSSGFVVGVDLCGNPARGDPAIFADAFRIAKAKGLGMTVHFAEVPQSSSDAELEELLSWRPDRLGHGIHITPRLAEVIESRGIGLELCLSCNVLGKLTDGGFSNHHFRRWYQSRCAVALGTDDVGVFGSSLSNEYLLASKHFHLSAAQVVELSRQAVRLAFNGRERMHALLDDFEQSEVRKTT